MYWNVLKSIFDVLKTIIYAIATSSANSRQKTPGIDMPPVYLTGGVSIPGDFIIYVVERGDTLFSISQNTQVPEWKNVYDNQLLTPE